VSQSSDEDRDDEIPRELKESLIKENIEVVEPLFLPIEEGKKIKEFLNQ